MAEDWSYFGALRRRDRDRPADQGDRIEWEDLWRKCEPARAGHVDVSPLDPQRASRYAAAAIDDECRTVAATPEGGRNDRLNIAGFKLAQLVAAGHADEGAVREALTSAARTAGLPDGEIASTLRSAFDAGRRLPRIVADLLQPPDVTVLDETNSSAQAPYEFVRGGDFILNTPARPVPVWGRGDAVLAAQGEATVIAGPQGVGKSTVAQHFALARAGFYSDVWGYPIEPGRRRVLYLAMDRPAQIARSLRRMVGEAWRDELNDRLVVWQGPPPHDLAKFPSLFADMCSKADADTAIVDSLKDAAIGLSDDEVGAGWNRARQRALASGVELLELHHQTKRSQHGGPPHDLADLYGSVWIGSGAGSVLVLWGAAGDPIVQVYHRKQPMEEIGPLRILHDRDSGLSSVHQAADLLAVARATATGISASDAARSMFETDQPTEAQTEKARRRLQKLVDTRQLRRIDGRTGGASQTPTRYVAVMPTEIGGDE